VTGVPKRVRGERETVRRFFEGAFDKVAADPALAATTARLIEPHLDPLPGWPEPVPRMKPIADRLVTGAWLGVQRAADRLGLQSVYTGFSMYPEARFEFSEGDAPDFAPLLTFCLDGVIYGGLVRVVTFAKSRLTRSRERVIEGQKARVDLYPGNDGLALVERANRFLLTEASLWDLARHDGGFDGAAPYSVRYESARYLWSPGIAGFAFCLRCGDLIRYRRAGRSGSKSRRIPICGRCLRSGSLDWPEHAVMPHTRGKWWLMCQRSGCTLAFAGSGQARFCPKHRASRITPSRRVRMGRPGEGEFRK
jgi:hypothetical protein